MIAGVSAALLSVVFVPPLTIPPTEVLTRLYSPLSPPDSSSESPFSSIADAGAGGVVKSLKSVNESDWYAAVWIWSRAAFMSSRLGGVAAIDARDPRRPSSPGDADGPGESCDFGSMCAFIIVGWADSSWVVPAYGKGVARSQSYGPVKAREVEEKHNTKSCDI